MKRIFILLCAVVMLFSSALALEEEDASSDVHETLTETLLEDSERPEYVKWLLEVAENELGYSEGKGGYTKYGEWAGDPCASWCAEFVCWCVNRVDELYRTELLNSVYPKWSGQNTGKNWFIREGRFVFRKGNCPEWGYQWSKNANHYLKKNEYIPHAGDLVFFSYNEAGDTEHVALIEYCTRREDGEIILHVIEGNNPDTVQRNAYKLNNSQVLGFGLPVDLVDTVMRPGNSGAKVQCLQQMLFDLAFLSEKDITGTYGSNTRLAVSQYQKTIMNKNTNIGITDRETYQSIENAWNEQLDNAPDTWLVMDE